MALIRMQADPAYRVHRSEPALIGFPVFDDQGCRLGEIGDLLVDTTLLKIPFAVVYTGAGERAGQKVIVPLLDMTVHADRQLAICRNAAGWSGYPADDGGPLPISLAAHVRTTYLPQVESHRILPAGGNRTEIAHDARMLRAFRPEPFIETAD